MGNGRVLFIINGPEDFIDAIRIRRLSRYFTAVKDYRVVYRDNAAKLSSAVRFFREIISYKPEVVYVELMAYSGCVAVMLAKFFVKFKYVLSTSDAYADLLKAEHNMLASRIARFAEELWLKSADYILTRNPLHAQWLKREKKMERVGCIEHSVDLEFFKNLDRQGVRDRLNLGGSLVVGLVGSLVWSKRYRFCYGWDLIEALRHVMDLDIKALIVGGGTGLDNLKRQAELYGLRERVVFTGRLPHNMIAGHIGAMDICVSTQTNDLAGYIRCPTKLSEYMACGKYIISTSVGYATIYVDKVGELLPYEGIKDDSYPHKLAGRLRRLYHNRDLLDKGKNGAEIAKERLDDKVLGKKLEELIAGLLKTDK